MRFDIVVIGAGHAGVEAAHAAARLGMHVGCLHALGRHRGAHALQSRRRRDGQGTSRSRDRRAGRAHGSRHRCDGYSVQASEPQPWSRRVVTARAGGQEGLQRLGPLGAGVRTEHRVAVRQGGPDSDRARPGRRAGDGGRRSRDVFRARRDHRNIPERAGAHRAGAASRGPGDGTAVARSGRVDQGHWIRVRTPQDRHAATTRSREHRLRTSRRGRNVRRRTGRRSAGALLVRHGRDQSPSDRLLSAAHDRARAIDRAREHRSLSAVQRADPRHRSTLLPVARGQDHPVSGQGAAPDLSRAGGNRVAARST